MSAFHRTRSKTRPRRVDVIGSLSKSTTLHIIAFHYSSTLSLRLILSILPNANIASYTSSHHDHTALTTRITTKRTTTNDPRQNVCHPITLVA